MVGEPETGLDRFIPAAHVIENFWFSGVRLHALRMAMNKSTPRILLVEDDPTDVLLLQETLGEIQGAPFALIQVSRLEDALKRLGRERFDAVLLDLGLPDSQGLATLGELQFRHPEVPILVLSSSNDENLAVKVVAAGAQDYLVKGSYRGSGLRLAIQFAIERKRADAGLHEARQMLQLVMNHMPQSIFWKDRDSVFLGGNYRLAADAGLDSAEDVKGKTDSEMPWAQYAALYTADDREVMETDTPKLNIVEPLTRANGAQVWLRTSKVPLHDSRGQVVGVLCAHEDITEQKMAEVAIQEARRDAELANRAKSEFLSRLSHELRTPLNAILGFGQILDRQSAPPITRECIGHILRGGRYLLDLINEILEIASVDSGRLELSLEPIALGDVIVEACSMMRLLAEEYHVPLINQCVELESRFVLADRQRLKQVLINLLANGIKYNRAGGQVEISWRQSTAGRLAIAVSDTGPGISPENLVKLFVPFERLGAADTAIEGSGLGLVLSRRLATAMHGTLTVESTPEHGSIFTVDLREADSPTEPTNNFSDGVPQVEPAAAEARIFSVLCIEDNASNLRLIEVIFAGRPEITLLTAIQGSVGLDLARHHRPDLILLDLNLPDISGKEVLERLKAFADTCEIPVVIVSADASENQIEKLMASGARAFLTKPLDIEQFLHTVDTILK